MTPWMRTFAALAVAVGLAALFAVSPDPYGARAAPDQEGESCTLVPDKVASPARVRLGETVQIRLSLMPNCPAASYRSADIVLVIDRSRSMLNSGKLDAAKAAARTFVQVTDLGIHQVGVVGFHDAASLEQALSRDEAALVNAIDALQISTGTNIAAAIDISFQELQDNGRPDALPVIILITDGSPNRPRIDPDGAAIRSANFAKLGGVEIFAIGLGNDVDSSLLRTLASADANYYFAPDASELEIVYRSIALLVGDFAVRDLILDDELTVDVDLVAGSPNPTPNISGKRMRWSQGLVPAAGFDWVYTVKPNRTGTFPTNVAASATFRDVKGNVDRVEFPIPEIEVLAAEPTEEPEICNVINSWTLMVHSFPDTVGVSTAGDGCNNRFDSGDWPLGSSQRLPNLTYELTDARDTVLFTGAGVPGAGRVDQWLYIRVCEPPPYTLRLLTSDLDGFEPCYNSPVEREITIRDFRPQVFRRHQERFGFIP